MLCKEIITVYWDIHTQHICTQVGKVNNLLMLQQAGHVAFTVLNMINYGTGNTQKWWKHETGNITAPVTVKGEGLWGYCQQVTSLVSNLPVNWNISVTHLNSLWQAEGSLTLQLKHSQQFDCLCRHTDTFPYSVPKYCCAEVSTPASYSEGCGFKTQPGH